jgi:hypothetical protein
MKKLFILFAAFLLVCSFNNANAQDTIVKKDGNRIICNIQKEDSANVYFELERNGNRIESYIQKKDVSSIGYNKKVLLAVSTKPDIASFGLGLGQDFGGVLGGNLTIYPQKNLGLFLGAGYAVAGFGYNLGVKLRIISDTEFSPFSPYFTAMYGYNAAIAVENASQLNKVFYGSTIGIGFDYRSFPEKQSYWSLGIYLPIRGSEVENYIDDLKKNHGVEMKSDLLPITFSIGYHFIIN